MRNLSSPSTSMVRPGRHGKPDNCQKPPIEVEGICRAWGSEQNGRAGPQAADEFGAGSAGGLVVCQKLLCRRLGLGPGPLANVPMADVPALIDQDERRPEARPVGISRSTMVVSRNGVGDLQPLDRLRQMTQLGCVGELQGSGSG